ncbi:hypothetical protein [Chitinophaga sp.]|uniref:hypothetical protein n=1 Tax=Chitinophaga sp. TaxID=1869181 RepID=UPI0031D7FA16
MTAKTLAGLGLCMSAFTMAAGQATDFPFHQPVSLQYAMPDELKGSVLKKVITDYNDNVHVLTDKGFYRTSGEALVRDVRFRPLAEKIPLDVTAQEGSGHLYYLYADKWLTNGYAGIPYMALPVKGRYNQLAVAANGSVLLAGPGAAALAYNGKLVNCVPPPEELEQLQVHNGRFYARTAKGIYYLDGEKFVLLQAVQQPQAMAFRNGDVIIGTRIGYYAVNSQTGDTSLRLQQRVPVPDISALLVRNGRIWAGTPEGAFAEDSAGLYRYFASRRWLNENAVKSMAVDGEGNIYLLSPTGLNRISFPAHTLAEKAAYFQRKIRERHIRYGFIANLHLSRPGDAGTSQMADTDNDGLWTAFYLGSQAFRYAVTKEPKAKRYAWEGFEAFERILSVNQLKGFPSRTFERKGYKNSDPERWRDSPDPEWEWKGHTSSDEFVAYIWIAAVLHEMVAETPEEQQRVAAFIDKIMTHIIDNKYYFVDIDGKPTLWGRWNPEYINWYPETIGDRKLGSTTIIAGLQLGYALTGKKKYKDEAMRLMNKHGYLKNILIDYRKITYTPGYKHMGIDMGTGGWNHSDDEMAFLTYWVLYRYAFTDQLKQQYAGVIRNHWEMERPEKNAVWDLITLGTAGDSDADATLWWLRTFPMDLVTWQIKNSHRKDLTFLPANFREQTTERLIPLDEQPVHRHNANAFNLDGGRGGATELAGDEYLLPYWMARFLKVLK